MKHLILLSAVFIGFNAYTQSFVMNNNMEALKIGDKLPPLPVGKIMDNEGKIAYDYNGKSSFSAFKGKIIIFDFWATNCPSCIEGFPKMAELQEKFKNDIQVFLVNPSQTGERIKKWLEKINRDRKNSNIIPGNLPIIAEAASIKKFFPDRGEIGYHVWIDKNGVVRLRGISQNTHEKKIKELIAGKDISFIEDNPLAYNGEKLPFYFSNNAPSATSLKYSSSFGGFVDKLANPYGNGANNIIDSASMTQRNAYLNRTILYLYKKALASKIQKDTKVLFGNRIRIDVADKSLITLDRDHYNGPVTDEIIRKTKFGYEQIVPLSVADEEREQLMLEDLNRYFGVTLGINGNLEKQSTPCLKLIENNMIEKIKTKKSVPGSYPTMIGNNKMLVYECMQLNDIFRHYFSGLEYVQAINFKGLIVDASNYAEKVDITLPAMGSLTSLDELRGHLKNYGLDLIPGSHSVNFLVIKSR